MKVEIRKLTVTYQDHDHALLAVDRVDLGLTPGRVTALVGESGSGKTTLAKAVLGLLPENAQVSGSISLDGKEVVGLSEEALNGLRWSQAAMVFQSGAANLNPVHRLIDQVAEPLIQHRGADPREARGKAREALLAMGLEPDQVRRFPHELSGGQVQRGLLAMALILDPPVLILDEPTAALDAVTKAFISGVVRRLRERGKSILLITHDLDLAANLADDMAVLYLGRIMETLPARDLFLEAGHPYTLALARSYPGLEACRELGGIRGDAFYRFVHAHAQENGPDHRHSHVAAPESWHRDGHAPARGCLFLPRCTQALEECGHKEIDLVPAGGHRVRCLRGGIVDLLVLKGVAKSYGDTQALRPVDLNIKAGEVFCLVGETGSGKTTLALTAAGDLVPDQGNRLYDGRDMDVLLKRERRFLASRIGMIHQNPAQAVSHRLSVLDLVAEPLKIQRQDLSKGQIKERVVKALSEVHLSTAPEFLRRYPHELNMGAIQRVCLARALVHDPVLLVADEPTSALDPSVQAKVLKILLDLQIEKGLTMLFVTHDLGLARKVADRIGVMLKGRMVEMGPAARLINNPGHPYTRLLLESARGRAVSAAGTDLPTAPESGCLFSNRCAHVTEECRLDSPGPVHPDGKGHQVWCFRPLNLGAGETGDKQTGLHLKF